MLDSILVCLVPCKFCSRLSLVGCMCVCIAIENVLPTGGWGKPGWIVWGAALGQALDLRVEVWLKEEGNGVAFVPIP